MDELKIKMYSLVIDCPDPSELAKFYAGLLGWEIPYQDDDYVVLAPKGAKQGAYPGITFQREPDFVRPIWPTKGDAQQQMQHIDFAVNDLDKAVRYATKCGATIAQGQSTDNWMTMLDPVGHPFDLIPMPQIFDVAE